MLNEYFFAQTTEEAADGVDDGDESDETETIIGNDNVGIFLDNNKNISYQGTIYLGSGDTLQPVRGIFDTGSANPWILSKESVGDNANGNQFFDPDLTKTVEEGGHYSEPDDMVLTTISFGSGSLSGYFVTDTLTLGDPDDDEQ